MTRSLLSQPSDKIKKAKTHLAKATGLLHQEPIDKQALVNRIRAAMNRCLEEWFARKGVDIVYRTSRHSFYGEFETLAPERLVRKINTLRGRLQFLYEGAPYSPELLDNQHPPDGAWTAEAQDCMACMELLIEFLTNGSGLPSLKWEPLKPYRVGQWVKHYMQTQCTPKSWIYFYKKIIGMDAFNLTLRSEDERTLGYFDKYALTIFDSERPDETGTPFEKRRNWFDRHPEYRQIPLVIKHPGAGLNYARYFTCPACGYPVWNFSPDTSFDLGGNPYFYEICLLCDWADLYDYRYSEIQEEVEYDPNFGYTLSRARENFEKYLCIFTPQDGPLFAYNTEKAVLSLKKKLCAIYDEMIMETGQEPIYQENIDHNGAKTEHLVCLSGQGRIYLLWHQAEEIKKALMVQLQKAQQSFFDFFQTKNDEDGHVIGRDFSFKWQGHEDFLRPGLWLNDYLGRLVKIIAVTNHYPGDSYLVRNTERVVRPSSMLNASLRDRQPDEMTSPFYIRRSWYEVHTENLQGHFPCPACGFPTLSEMFSGKPCYLCGWKDDGQDDHDVNEVKGTNGDYTLSAARKNFVSHFSMYHSTKEHKGHFFSEVLQIKKALVNNFYLLITETDETTVRSIWKNITAQKQALTAETNI